MSFLSHICLLVWCVALVGGVDQSGHLFDCAQHPTCVCTEQVVKCVSAGLIQVPIFSPFLVQLNLSRNALSQLKPSAFVHLSQLQSLDMSHNQVKELPSLVFSGMGNLKELNLAHNRIERIHKDSFKNLHELRELRLEGNSLLHLHGDVFYDLHALERLVLLHRRPLPHTAHYDQRALLCHCPLLATKWNLQDTQFAFCKKIQSYSDQEKGQFCASIETENNLIEPILTVQSATQLAQQVTVSTERLASKLSTLSSSTEPKRAPIWTNVPESPVRTKAGNWLVWKCAATGSPKPMIKWVRGTKVLVHNDTLILGPVGPKDEGTYECVASNEAGMAAKEVRLCVTGGVAQDQDKKYARLDLMGNSSELLRSEVVQSRQVASALGNITEFVEVVRLLLRKSDGNGSFTSDDKVQADWLTPIQQMVMFNYTGCVGGTQTQVLDCEQFVQFRAVTGVCNNLQHPLWGSQMTPFVRLLPARYEDGLAKPVGWFADRKYHNHTLPNAKKVTSELLATSELTPDPVHNHMLMQFGQFLDHDLTFTAPSRSWNILENSLLDCRKTCHYVEPCFSVSRPPKSRGLWSNCIEVIRSAEMCGTGFTSVVHGKFIRREQVNQLTAFVDGSNIYGSTVELARYLRDLNPDRGLLKTSQVNGRSYLPLSDEHFPLDCQLQPMAPFMECFLAGDHRANEQIGLLAFHNSWLRQHNRLATRMRELHPDWSGERIYQETRKIVGAQLQVITYRDWLPLVLGQKGMQLMGSYKGQGYYDPTADPAISNVFATAAMRFGHTLVNTHLIRKLSSSRNSSRHDMKLRKIFFASHLLYQPRRADSILRGLFITPLKKPKPEQAISSELTEHLFTLSRHVPLDLASINIQRGRDHALPSYNEWRSYCKLTRANTFDDLAQQITNADIRAKLEHLYGHPDNIDLWVGAIMEDVDEDAKVGPTFRCLLADQFHKLRAGDRYFYKLPTMFTMEQLVELEKTTLSRVICANSDNMSTVLVDAFKLPKHQNWTRCEELPDVDLTKW